MLSSCPCPRCLVSKSKIPLLGTKADMAFRSHFLRTDDEETRLAIEIARNLLYVEGKGFNSQVIIDGLGSKSLLPTQNAFSKLLAQFGFDFYKIIPPDLLHEFELGVWKAVFIHLVHILHAEGGGKIQELNWRFQSMPTFGQDTIRKFSNNVSATTHFAGRDFEDMLQCAIPAFARLLPEPRHDRLVRKLLFELATWHALAKLRRQSEQFVTELEASTFWLVQLLLWIGKNKDDPAIDGFVNRLKTHLLTRFLGKPFDADEEAYSNTQLAQVIITNNHIYQHQTLRVNYTSYDLRREQDSINLCTNSDIMLLSNKDHDLDEDPLHPYWYAHVLGIFHAWVVYVDPEKGTYLDKEMEFLWVHCNRDATDHRFMRDGAARLAEPLPKEFQTAIQLQDEQDRAEWMNPDINEEDEDYNYREDEEENRSGSNQELTTIDRWQSDEGDSDDDDNLGAFGLGAF
ncbi:hypothetical protein H1R20_g16022, partial [Candolleomyces eurysporus]